MEAIEIAKNVLSRMIKTAGENGVTEGEAVSELTKYGFDYYTALNSLRNAYKEVAEVERTPEHTGAVICYRKRKKEPEESVAIKLAKRTMGERERMNILNQYKR